MSTTVGTRAVPQPSGGQAQPPPGGQEQAGGLNLASAMALVIGSIIGTGVFTLPAVMAAGGTSSLGVLAVVGVGAMMLAVLFGQLTRRGSTSSGVSGMPWRSSQKWTLDLPLIGPISMICLSPKKCDGTPE